MKLIAERSDILPAIQRVSGIVSRANVSAVLGNILMDAADNMVTVRANNLDMEATATFPATVSEQGRITLQAATMLDAIKSLPLGADVQIVHGQDDPRAKLSSGRSRFNIPSLPADMFPSFSSLDDGEEIEIEATKLRAALDLIGFAMMTGEKYPVCHSVFITVTPEGEIKAIAASEIRIATTVLGETDGPFTAIIPRDFVNQATRVLDGITGPVTLRSNGRLARLAAPTLVLAGKLLDGPFISYDRAIPPPSEHKLGVGRDTMIAALRRALIMSDKSSAVRLDISVDTLAISTRKEDSGQADDEIACEWNGPDMSVRFNGASLIEILSRVETEAVEIEITPERGAVVKDGRALFAMGVLRG